MSRVFHYGVATAVGTLLGGVAHAQDLQPVPGTTVTELDPLVITGVPSAREAEDLPPGVDVISGAEKRRRQSASLGESIDQLAGADTINTGSNVGKPVLRGFSGNRVRVLADGIALDHQQFGVRHPPNVDPFIADRLEVVRGAQSLLYGSGAIGGVVNVIPDAPPTAPMSEFTFSGETTLEYQAGFEQITAVQKLEAAYGRWGIAATLVGRESNGFDTPNGDEALDSGDPSDPLVTGELPFTDYEQINGDINLGYMTDIGQIVLRYERYDSEHNFLVPDPPPPNGNPLQPGGIGQSLENDTVQFKADLAISDLWTLKPKLTYSSNLRVSNPGPPEPLPRSQLPGARVIDIRRDNYTARLDAEHGQVFGFLEGRMGIEGLYVDQQSRGSTVLTPGGQVSNLAAFVFEEATIDRWTLTAGGRIDYREIEADPSQTAGAGVEDVLGQAVADDKLENDFFQVTGALGAEYALSQNLSVLGSVSRAYRAPNLFELYADGVHGGVQALQIGDPDLGPETTITVDGGFQWRSDWGSAKVTGYYNDIADFIFLARTGETDPRPDSNLPIFRVSQQDAVVYGVDLTVDAELTDWLKVRGTLGYVDGELDDGTQVPLLPPIKLAGEVTFHQDRLGLLDSAYLTIGARYAGAQDSAGLIEPFGQFDEPPPPFGTASTDAYTLFDVSMGGTIASTGTELEIAATNVFDTEYRDFLDTYKNITLGPGRNIILRVTQPF